MLSLLEMSVAGAVMILAVMAVRIFAVKWLPKVTLRLLWMAVLCRLLMPLRVPSPTSIYAAAERFGRMAGKPGLLLEGRESIQAAAPNPGISPFILLWAAGTLLLAFYFVYCHIRSRRGYREALPLEHPFVKAWLERHRLRRPVRVRVSDQIGSPLTYGILWPVILLPKNLDWEDTRGLGFILAHETAHIRYFDALGKWLLAAGLCLHWFNPLVWVMYLLANRDLELSCDEAVVQEYGRDARASYALTLVGLEEQLQQKRPYGTRYLYPAFSSDNSGECGVCTDTGRCGGRSVCHQPPRRERRSGESYRPAKRRHSAGNRYQRNDYSGKSGGGS